MAPTGHAYRLVAWNHAWKVVEPRTEPTSESNSTHGKQGSAKLISPRGADFRRIRLVAMNDNVDRCSTCTSRHTRHPTRPQTFRTEYSARPCCADHSVSLRSWDLTSLERRAEAAAARWPPSRRARSDTVNHPPTGTGCPTRYSSRATRTRHVQHLHTARFRLQHASCTPAVSQSRGPCGIKTWLV